MNLFFFNIFFLKIEESRKSFPSGHSSSTFFGMIFLCIYIHRVWSKPSLGVLPNLLQVCCLGTAVFVALSRVLDNKHHPTDVLTGSVIGVVIGSLTGYYLNLFFLRFHYRAKYNLVIPRSSTSSLELRKEEVYETSDPDGAQTKVGSTIKNPNRNTISTDVSNS